MSLDDRDYQLNEELAQKEMEVYQYYAKVAKEIESLKAENEKLKDTIRGILNDTGMTQSVVPDGHRIDGENYDNARDNMRKIISGIIGASNQFEKENERLRAEKQEFLEVLKSRMVHGHNDTCGFALSIEYPCSCGQDDALILLSKHQQDVKAE